MNCRSLLSLLILFLHALLVPAFSKSTQNPITGSVSDRFLALQASYNAHIAHFHMQQAIHFQAIDTKLSLIADALSVVDSDINGFKALLAQAETYDGNVKVAMRFLDDAARMLEGVPKETMELQRLAEQIARHVVEMSREMKSLERFIGEANGEVEELRGEIQNEIKDDGTGRNAFPCYGFREVLIFTCRPGSSRRKKPHVTETFDRSSSLISALSCCLACIHGVWRRVR
jgi:hypothetical protein